MRSRRGFTLIEVMLALGLSAMVLGLLSMAIHVQLRATELGRKGVEEAQLARTILHRIAQDLRGMIRYEPVDMTKLVNTASSSSTTTTGGVGGAGGAGTAGSTSSTNSSSESESDSSSTLIPILVGTLTRLEVDVSLVPGTEQFQQLSASVDGSGTTDRPSDARTVAYFMANESTGIVDLNAGGRNGLVRRDLDRSVTRWASEQGQLDQFEQDLEPLAPEVTAIEFRYYDGSEWQESWDSQEQESLPLAVEITLLVARKQQRATGLFASIAPWSPSGEEVESVVYRLIVQLPAAKRSQSSGGTSSSSSSDGTSS